VREIVEAITKWEPRVRVLSVTMNLVAEAVANLLITIVWQLKVDVSGVGQQRLTLTVPKNLT